MSDQQDALRGRVTEALEGYDKLITSWVLSYETSGITGDGEFGNGWGSIYHASDPVAVGLCRLTAREIESGAS